MRVAWLAGAAPAKERRLTPNQQLHRDALAALAARKVHDREKARELFAEERRALDALMKKHNLPQGGRNINH